jgi:hypothetical protein
MNKHTGGGWLIYCYLFYAKASRNGENAISMAGYPSRGDGRSSVLISTYSKGGVLWVRRNASSPASGA